MQRGVGLVFNIQRFSVQDGPGIRTTVFLKGCPLNCFWCHNPEGIAGAPEVMVNEARCFDCGECAEACPTGALRSGLGSAQVEGCTVCATCVTTCPTEARQLAGRKMTVAEVVAEIRRDRIFYDDSGGGATFSGGEPLSQPTFLAAALAACRELEIHTAVDTSGFCRQRDLLDVAGAVDLFLFDLKVADDDNHKKHTGVSNVRILENLDALARVHDNIWIRVPVVPGVNDDHANMVATARIASRYEAVRKVSLLPYHATGAAKAERVGRTPPPADLERPSEDALAKLAEVFAEAGLETHLGA